MIEAKIIAKSYAPNGQEIVTVQATHHRFVLAELNTHRVFSRNSASSRAIPVAKIIKNVQTDPAMPLYYAYNQPGMQAASKMTPEDAQIAEDIILGLRNRAAEAADALASLGPINENTGKPLGLHKQWANRYLEAWMWHTVIITSTEWDNFYRQRDSNLAQPEIEALAKAIHKATFAPGVSAQRLDYGDWHLPYVDDEDRRNFPPEILVKISAARCARVSYLTQEGTKDVYADLKLFDRLTHADPPHWSPLEHVATPWKPKLIKRWQKPLGNFDAFSQLRHNVYYGGHVAGAGKSKMKLQ